VEHYDRRGAEVTAKISITLPSIYPDALRRSLANIRDTTSNPVEILVVTPSIEPFDPGLRHGQSIVWIKESAKRGCAAAHAEASRAATGDFITPTADDCDYLPGWDDEALSTYFRRAPKTGSMFCLGLHHGYVGTAFGIYFPAFSFMKRSDALDFGYFDSLYLKDFTDPDFGMRVWSIGGRCEFTEKRLVHITDLDARKGGEKCLPEDLERFVRTWGARFGKGCDTSHMRAIIVDFDPEAFPEFVTDGTVFNNTPEFIAKIADVSPPHLVESADNWNIVWFRRKAYALAWSAGPVDLNESENDLERIGARIFPTISEAREFVLRQWGKEKVTATNGTAACGART
jgi:hypothetical protein